MMLLIAAGSLTFFAFWQRQHDLNSVNYRICLAIRNIQVIQTAQLRGELANLHRLAYFHDHPEELQRQQYRIQYYLARYKPRMCR